MKNQKTDPSTGFPVTQEAQRKLRKAARKYPAKSKRTKESRYIEWHQTPFFESELFNELNDALRHSSRFTATYRIAADDYAEAKKNRPRHRCGTNCRMP